MQKICVCFALAIERLSTEIKRISNPFCEYWTYIVSKYFLLATWTASRDCAAFSTLLTDWSEVCSITFFRISSCLGPLIWWLQPKVLAFADNTTLSRQPSFHQNTYSAHKWWVYTQLPINPAHGAYNASKFSLCTMRVVVFLIRGGLTCCHCIQSQRQL